MNPKIGWIGTGVIGGSCVRRLLDAGYSATLYTRTAGKAEPLVALGATLVNSPKEVALASDVVLSTVGYPDDVREIFFGENGIYNAWKDAPIGADALPKIYVDMTTSSPNLAQEIDAAARRAGFVSLDAPVSGGDVGAKNGTLSIMVGGDAETLRRATPILANLGTNIRRSGGPGAGQRTKMANQILIAGGMIGVCEALLYAYKAGLDLDGVMESVSKGAAGSWSLSNYGPRILRGDYAPGFYVEHFVKDMGIALDDAQKMNLSLPGLALVKQLYLALVAQGGARKGTQALVQALATISNVDAFHDGQNLVE
ncbi:MAG: NAD(P)-dependent oxidoreductase [Thermoguttaceae bacterium]|nr:NAD(P)-dependent oxidoreductase [Thermoguttaceae bacterium]